MCFHGARERFAKDANVDKMVKSNICILGSKNLPNMRGGFGSVVNCSWELFLDRPCFRHSHPSQIVRVPRPRENTPYVPDRGELLAANG